LGELSTKNGWGSTLKTKSPQTKHTIGLLGYSFKLRASSYERNAAQKAASLELRAAREMQQKAWNLVQALYSSLETRGSQLAAF
jgi:hypothetical protein